MRVAPLVGRRRAAVDGAEVARKIEARALPVFAQDARRLAVVRHDDRLAGDGIHVLVAEAAEHELPGRAADGVRRIPLLEELELRLVELVRVHHVEAHGAVAERILLRRERVHFLLGYRLDAEELQEAVLREAVPVVDARLGVREHRAAFRDPVLDLLQHVRGNVLRVHEEQGGHLRKAVAFADLVVRDEGDRIAVAADEFVDAEDVVRSAVEERAERALLKRVAGAAVVDRDRLRGVLAPGGREHVLDLANGADGVRVGREFRPRRLVVVRQAELRELGVIVALLQHEVRETFQALADERPVRTHRQIRIRRVGAALAHFHALLVVAERAQRVIFRPAPVVHRVHVVAIAVRLLHSDAEEVLVVQRPPAGPLHRVQVQVGELRRDRTLLGVRQRRLHAPRNKPGVLL